MSTTVAASVLDPAAGAVSVTRITSPPMLLGRKLLKNVATKKDDVNFEKPRCTCCARSSTPQRQALATIMPR
jgi:hypothetical protein